MRRIISAILVAMLWSVAVPAVGVAAGKAKVFVTGGDSWQTTDSTGAQSPSGVNATAAEGIKLFREQCPAVEVNMRRDKADYVVALSDDGSGAGRKGRRAVVFTPDGEILFANSTRSLKNAVKDACRAISTDWTAKGTSAKQ